jgi:hypothetical protein
MNCSTRLSVVRLRGFLLFLWGHGSLPDVCGMFLLGGFRCSAWWGGGVGVSWCFDSRFVGVVSHILVVNVCTLTLFGAFGCASMGLDLGGRFRSCACGNYFVGLSSLVWQRVLWLSQLFAVTTNPRLALPTFAETTWWWLRIKGPPPLTSHPNTIRVSLTRKVPQGFKLALLRHSYGRVRSTRDTTTGIRTTCVGAAHWRGYDPDRACA